MKQTFAFIIRGILLLLLFSSINFYNIEGKAQEKNKTIKVAFPIQAGLSEYSDEKGFSGYTYEYLSEISNLLGINFEYVVREETNENLLELLHMLETGEIDLMGAMNYNESLEETYDYIKPDYGYSYRVLCTLKDSEINEYNCFSRDNLNIAIMNITEEAEKAIKKQAKKEGCSYTLIKYKTEEKIIQALEEGKADVFLTSSLSNFVIRDDIKMVAQLTEIPFYFAVTKGNDEVAEILTEGMKQIELYSALTIQQLHEKYFPTLSSNELSKLEKEYLAEKNKFDIILPNWCEAFVEYDKKEKTYKGAAIDYLTKIEEFTGISFRYIMAQSYEEYCTMINSKNYDLVMGLPYSYKEAEQKDVFLTQPFNTSNLMFVGKDSFATIGMEGKKIAIVSPVLDIEEWYQNCEIIYCDTYSETIELVMEKKVDYALGIMQYLQYELMKKGINNAYITPIDIRQKMSIGIIKPIDQRLISILNKGIARISEAEDFNIIFENALNVEKTVTIKEFAKQHLEIVIILLSIFFLVAIWGFQQKSALVKRVMEEKKWFQNMAELDGLTGIYNSITCKDKIRRYLEQNKKGIYALFIIDIDYFKKINDTYGHLTGDRILQNVAKTLREICSEQDIAGRIGGDEFLIFLKETRKDNVESHYKILVQKFKEYNKALEVNATLSIGVCICKGKKDFNYLYKNADKALYEAKQRGRDQIYIEQL